MNDKLPCKYRYCITEVEFLLQLYPTQEVRKQHIIYGAIIGTMIGSPREVINEGKARGLKITI